MHHHLVWSPLMVHSVTVGVLGVDCSGLIHPCATEAQGNQRRGSLLSSGCTGVLSQPVSGLTP